MKPSETPFEAARRALKEELGIQISPELVSQSFVFFIEDRPPVISTSFPGLWTKRTLYISDFYLPSNCYQPEGYVENQSDKSTYFVWQRVSED